MAAPLELLGGQRDLARMEKERAGPLRVPAFARTDLIGRFRSGDRAPEGHFRSQDSGSRNGHLTPPW
jgi:hypothetical protein